MWGEISTITAITAFCIPAVTIHALEDTSISLSKKIIDRPTKSTDVPYSNIKSLSSSTCVATTADL